MPIRPSKGRRRIKSWRVSLSEKESLSTKQELRGSLFWRSEALQEVWLQLAVNRFQPELF
jgi:hypothetical protein